MTSENIKGVRTIGSHVVDPLTVLAIESRNVDLFAGAAAVIFQQIAGKDVVTGALADFTNLPLDC
jgi:hypothetical protein